ncbi:MAG: phage tail sheath C-terminal domain-containing protein, partial [Pseudomonadota bacterium]
PEAVDALLDVPVPVESWSDFETLFAWDQRPAEADSAIRLPCPLGLAVRGFFAEGGVKAYVVRTGDPLPLLDRGDAASVIAAKRRLVSWAAASPPANAELRVPLLPGFADQGTPADAGDPATWHGAAHVWGLDDVALLSLPDLPDLFAGPPGPASVPPGPPPPPEIFKTCAPLAAGTEPDARLSRLTITAPRLDRAGYLDWSNGVSHVLRLLAAPRGPGHRRDVMLVASLPLPSLEPDATPPRSEAWPLALLDEVDLPGEGQRLLDTGRLGSARLQLAYPWIETAASAGLPEGVEGAEGVLLGAIARTSLQEGAFRSAAGTALVSVMRTLPELGSGDIATGLPSGRADWLGDRLSLVGFKAGRTVILSDATASSDRQWRPGGVSRLMNVILRAAKSLGGDKLFESAGPALWASLRRELEGFMGRLWDAGALSGASPAEAYSVRCDATTMSQSDIDAGRTIVGLAFTAAQPIQKITVTLALLEASDAVRSEAA